MSTAGSLELPLGPRIRKDELAGYYIDFRAKCPEPDTPPPWLPPITDQMHVETAQWGLGCLERHALGEGDQWLEAAIWAGRHLIAIEEEGGRLPQLKDYPHTFKLDAPWLSALGQGETASLLVRLFAETGDDAFADSARSVLEPMRVRTADGGCMDLLEGEPFPEEYPTTPPSFVLNGGIFAIWGFLDVALGLQDDRARADFERCVDALANNMHRWDTGWWSRYDLFPHPVANIASPAYHALHITQLEAMQLVAPRPQFALARDRFASYLESPWNERRAFAAKAVFRLLVPRNTFLARRVPTSPASK